MRLSLTHIRIALLGSALAFAALTPAVAGSRDASQRLRAMYGNHPSVVQLSQRGASQADPTYTVLHDFAGGPNDGGGSGANVTLDDAGNIYGTTDFGGANGQGTVFKLAPDGTQTLLHSFSGSDGAAPDGAVLLMPNGDLYGTAGGGGSTGSGVLFKITAKGKFKVLHDFDGNTDGSFLRGNLIRDELGNVYGTALFGGTTGDGTVYKYGADGTFTVLHTFNDTDGLYPEHGVVSDRAGNLYGVTAFGGANGEGTVYRLSSKGKLKTLYSFTGQEDGGFLYGGLALDKDRNIYGTTVGGGANAAGTVFKLTKDGTLTTLYNFTGGTDGGGPEGDTLLVGKTLYGTASSGGDPTCQCGAVYQVNSSGQEKVVHAFTGGDGGGYSAGVVENDHVFYGTTASGGATSNGVVFSVTKK